MISGMFGEADRGGGCVLTPKYSYNLQHNRTSTPHGQGSIIIPFLRNPILIPNGPLEYWEPHVPKTYHTSTDINLVF